MYRNLTAIEISKLESQNCKADNWDNIHVKEVFSTKNILNVTFSGNVKLGLFQKSIKYFGGVKKQSGIYYTHIHNCTVGDNCLISQIKNYIANYNLGEEVVIENTELLAVEGKSYFGNGTKIDVLDETGGRQLLIYDKLSAHNAYFQAFYRHRPDLKAGLEKMIQGYCDSKYNELGSIGNKTRISNCKQITNVNIGSYAILSGVNRLNNGSINSNDKAPVTIGPSVIADNFIISSGSEVSDGTIITNCFIGQGCILSKHYSAVHSLFFANCQGFNGEACSIFAGPYTVTHHKSTLLISGMFSFLNAGSGSNQSNHMYKLGPIHHGIAERGTKTTSDSYLLWPAKIGAFTLVMGRHYKNPDTSDMPFSYLIENNDKSYLVPAINLRSVGTIRDAMKWPKRDNRKDPELLDCINYNLLSPYTISKMVKGNSILKELKSSSKGKDEYNWQNTSITKNALERGINLYQTAIMKFVGNSVISKISGCKDLNDFSSLKKCLIPDTNIGEGEWVDLAGLISPKHEVEKLIKNIESKKVNNLEEVENYFKYLHENYYSFEWTWAAQLMQNIVSKKIEEVSVNDLIKLIENWIKSVVTLDELLYKDARKEFTLSAMTSFGVDGDHETKKQDFEEVRGSFEKNAFVTEILNHIERKSKLGRDTIDLLKKLE